MNFYSVSIILCQYFFAIFSLKIIRYVQEVLSILYSKYDFWAEILYTTVSIKIYPPPVIFFNLAEKIIF